MPHVIKREDAIFDVRSRYVILEPDGTEYELDTNSVPAEGLLEKIKDPLLRKYIANEGLSLSNGGPPPSIDAMKKLELVDYEAASDSGHFRFYPDGELMIDILSSWAYDIAVRKFGAMKIETPLLYDWSVREIREQGESFHERHYNVSAGKNRDKWVLRFAGDFGLFKMMRETGLSYRNLPLRVYELSKSFRYERRGELSGLKRLRAFTMPDIHSFTADSISGWKEYSDLFMRYSDLADSAGIEYVLVFRVLDSFFEENRDGIIQLLNYSGRPAYIEILSRMKHYWIIKNEFQGIDSAGGSCQLSTVQLDVVDSERYGIGYVAKDGMKNGCTICHSSIGSLERWIYILLEEAIKMEKPELPLWISPTQVRVIPVSGEYVEEGVRICSRLNSLDIRCDVDDRNETLAKKVAEAGKKWVPYVAVVGRKELESGLVSVSVRRGGSKMRIKEDDLASRIKDQTRGMPSMQSSLPVLLSRRPVFRS